MSADFFPRATIQWKALEDPALARRISLSLPEMALISGVVLRLYRAYVLTHGSSSSWLWVAGTFLLGLIFMLLMLTAHLANFTMRHWWWRAPAFAVLQAGTEIVMSLALTAVGWETYGSEVADLSVWWPSAERVLWTRMAITILFTLILAFVVRIIRSLVVRRERRASGAASAIIP